MKKLLAFVIVCVLSVNVVNAQDNKFHRGMMRPHFENLDSATRAKVMDARRDFWEKQMKKNEKRWKKQMASGNMGGWSWTRRGFVMQPQEQMPQFVGGEEALLDWIQENITYPVLAEEASIEGKVVVAFDVNNDGSIGNVQVKESDNALLNLEIVDKLETMPNWIPAKQNGRNVKVRYTLPIKFTALS